MQDIFTQLVDETKNSLKTQWSDIRDENLNKFQTTFDTEHDVMMAQLRLIEFYNTHRDVMAFDPIQNELVILDDMLIEELASHKAAIENASMKKL